MPPVTGVLLALGASLAWGCADYVAGLQSRARPLLTVVLLTQLAGVMAMAFVVGVRGEGLPGRLAVALACLAGVAGAGAIAAFYRAMATGQMSIVAPLVATSTAVPVLVGFARGERPSALQLAGMAAAGVGVVVVLRSEAGGDTTRGGREALVLSLLAAALFGLVLSGLAVGADDDPYWTVLLYRLVSGSLAAAAVLALRHRPGVPLAAIPALAAVGVLDAGATVLFAVSTNHGLLTVVAVLASLYPIVTAGLAHAQLGERLRPVQLAAVLVVLAGVGAISAG